MTFVSQKLKESSQLVHLPPLLHPHHHRARRLELLATTGNKIEGLSGDELHFHHGDTLLNFVDIRSGFWLTSDFIRMEFEDYGTYVQVLVEDLKADIWLQIRYNEDDGWDVTRRMESPHPTPKLVASTTDTYCCTIFESRERGRRPRDGASEGSPVETTNGIEMPLDPEMDLEVNYFKSAQCKYIKLMAPRTPDGTTLLTSSADNTIRTFVIPPTLLTSPGPHPLTPYTSHSFPTSINCLAPYPLFNLSTPSTTVYLSTPTSLPIRLLNMLSPLSTPQATYPLINPTTETYLTPSSLLWPSPGHTFYTGTDCLIALFDVSRNGEGPVTRMPTIPSKRHKMKGGGVGMRGLVSALSRQENPGGEGILAAGTYTRWVSLYDSSGLGGTISTFSIESAADEISKIGGTGVTQGGAGL
ncbi:hypothetical protein B7494_g7773 [Chlorociboria aeruginascens]|nr:hypothetical protein B7494_g7773 [Chlorociboria aeruginascens]